jgi:hypothetical protein
MNAHVAAKAGHKAVEYQPLEHVLVPHGEYHVGQTLHLRHDGHTKHVHVLHVEPHDATHDRLLVSMEAPHVGERVH